MIDYVLIVLFTPILVCLFWFIELNFSNGDNVIVKRHLAFFMISAFFSFYGELVYFKEIYFLYSLSYSLITIFSFAQLPAFYLYLLSLTQPNIKLKTYLKHYSVPVLFGIVIIFFHNIFLSLEESSLFLKNYFHPETFNYRFRIVFYVELIMRNGFLIAGVFYFILIHKKIKIHLFNLINFCSDTEKKDLKWIRIYNLLFLIMTIFGGTLFNLKGRFQIYNFDIILFIPTLLLTIIIWMIGYLGNRQNLIVIINEIAEKNAENNYPISEDVKNNLISNLNDAMKINKIYLNSELCLPQLSKEIGTNRYYLSKIINEEYQCNFNHYINQYRIKYASELIIDNKNLNLSQIAFQCGYKSYMSFARNFSKFMNMTPDKFMKAQIKK